MTALNQTLIIKAPVRQPPAQRAAPATLRAVVLLDGGVRPNSFAQCIQRSVLDLPVDANHSVLQLWLDQVDRLRCSLGLDRLPMRVRTGSAHRGPRRSSTRAGPTVLLENDPVSFRGTAGVLRDVASAYQDHDNLLAIAGGQIPLVPLDRVFATMADARGDLTLLANPDQSPAEVLLFSARTMRAVSTRGYVDLKEQALPRIARDHRVMVARLPRPAAAPIRSRREYLTALRHYHRASRAGWMDPHEQQCFSSFAICEAGSRAAESAMLHDSVVLDGGIVESGAVVVRSVVCAGGRVKAGQTVVDATVCGRGLEPA